MQNKQSNQQLSPELERYLALCKRTYDRMVATGEWPWPDNQDVIDSPKTEDVVDSHNKPNDI